MTPDNEPATTATDPGTAETTGTVEPAATVEADASLASTTADLHGMDAQLNSGTVEPAGSQPLPTASAGPDTVDLATTPIRVFRDGRSQSIMINDLPQLRHDETVDLDWFDSLKATLEADANWAWDEGRKIWTNLALLKK